MCAAVVEGVLACGRLFVRGAARRIGPLIGWCEHRIHAALDVRLFAARAKEAAFLLARRRPPLSPAPLASREKGIRAFINSEGGGGIHKRRSLETLARPSPSPGRTVSPLFDFASRRQPKHCPCLR